MDVELYNQANGTTTPLGHLQDVSLESLILAARFMIESSATSATTTPSMLLGGTNSNTNNNGAGNNNNNSSVGNGRLSSLTAESEGFPLGNTDELTLAKVAASSSSSSLHVLENGSSSSASRPSAPAAGAKRSPRAMRRAPTGGDANSAFSLSPPAHAQAENTGGRVSPRVLQHQQQVTSNSGANNSNTTASNGLFAIPTPPRRKSGGALGIDSDAISPAFSAGSQHHANSAGGAGPSSRSLSPSSSFTSMPAMPSSIMAPLQGRLFWEDPRVDDSNNALRSGSNSSLSSPAQSSATDCDSPKKPTKRSGNSSQKSSTKKKSKMPGKKSGKNDENSSNSTTPNATNIAEQPTRRRVPMSTADDVEVVKKLVLEMEPRAFMRAPNQPPLVRFTFEFSPVTPPDGHDHQHHPRPFPTPPPQDPILDDGNVDVVGVRHYHHPNHGVAANANVPTRMRTDPSDHQHQEPLSPVSSPGAVKVTPRRMNDIAANANSGVSPLTDLTISDSSPSYGSPGGSSQQTASQMASPQQQVEASAAVVVDLDGSNRYGDGVLTDQKSAADSDSPAATAAMRGFGLHSGESAATTVGSSASTMGSPMSHQQQLSAVPVVIEEPTPKKEDASSGSGRRGVEETDANGGDTLEAFGDGSRSPGVHPEAPTAAQSPTTGLMVGTPNTSDMSSSFGSPMQTPQGNAVSSGGGGHLLRQGRSAMLHDSLSSQHSQQQQQQQQQVHQNSLTGAAGGGGNSGMGSRQVSSFGSKTPLSNSLTSTVGDGSGSCKHATNTEGGASSTNNAATTGSNVGPRQTSTFSAFSNDSKLGGSGMGFPTGSSSIMDNPQHSAQSHSQHQQTSATQHPQKGVKNWKYKKEKLIGSGADGKVYLAADLVSGEHLAVKELLIAPAARGDTRQGGDRDYQKMLMIKKQIDLLRKMPHHDNIVQHKGVERTTCSMNILMEYIAGGSITTTLNKLGAFNESVVRAYARHICTALAYLHERGVIHRDIKGANCLIGLDGIVKVADFGCCVIHSLNDPEEKKGIIGTSMWMSPECIQSHTVTEKTDIWSLGCTIVEMASGKPPWHEAHFTNEWAAMFYISQSGRGPPLPAHLSRQAHAFLKKCFAIDPDQRPSAAECLQDPFLAEEYDPDSENPAMRAPSPSELLPPHQFPNARGGNRAASTATTASLTSSITSDNEYATSNYSTFSFAVYDAEWGAQKTDDYDLGESLPEAVPNRQPQIEGTQRKGKESRGKTTTDDDETDKLNVSSTGSKSSFVDKKRSMGRMSGTATPTAASNNSANQQATTSLSSAVASLPMINKRGYGEIAGRSSSNVNPHAATLLADDEAPSAAAAAMPTNDNDDESSAKKSGRSAALRSEGEDGVKNSPTSPSLVSENKDKSKVQSEIEIAMVTTNSSPPRVGSAPSTPNTPVAGGDVKYSDIANFIAQTAKTAALTASMADEELLEDEDQLGFGLPEAILFTVFHFLDHVGLCQVAATSRGLRELVDLGAKEVLWKHLFLKVFGDVDVVRAALRKNWKQYYRNSYIHCDLVNHERYVIHRQLCQSKNVFEGYDNRTGDKVVIKLEPWQLQPVKVKKGATSAAAAQLNLNMDFSSTYELPARHTTSSHLSQRGTPSKRALPPTPTKQGTSSSAHSTPNNTTNPNSVTSSPGMGTNSTSWVSPVKGSQQNGGEGSVDSTPSRSGGGGSGGNSGRPPLSGLHNRTTSSRGVRSVGGSAPSMPSSSRGATGATPVAVEGTNTAGGGGGNSNAPTFLTDVVSPSSASTPTASRDTSGTNSPPPGAAHHLPSLPQPPNLPAMNPSPTVGGLPPQISRGRLLPRSKNRVPQPQHQVSIPPALSGFTTPHRRAMSPSAQSPAAGGGAGTSISPYANTVPSVGNSGDAGGGAAAVTLSPSSSSGVFVSGGGGSAQTGNTNSSSGRPDSSAPPSGITSRQSSWSDLYEYQRMSDQAPPTPSAMAYTRPARSLLQHQHKLLRHLEAMGSRHIPRPLAFSDTDAVNNNIIVTNAVGPSLNELLLFCGNQLSMRTVTQLTLRMLKALEEIHEHDVVHGGITPTNICMGVGETSADLYLINFGQSRYFRDPRTHRPTTTSTTSHMAQKARNQEFLSFCSTFVQRGCTPAPRDDIIAIGYVLCYLVHGGLPWIHEGKLNSQEVVTRKNAYMDILARTPPIQLHYFLKSGYALKQGEVPDFPYLSNLVSRMMRERGWEDDGVFDWSAQLKGMNYGVSSAPGAIAAAAAAKKQQQDGAGVGGDVTATTLPSTASLLPPPPPRKSNRGQRFD